MFKMLYEFTARHIYLVISLIVLPIAVLKPWFQDASFEYHKPYFPDNDDDMVQTRYCTFIIRECFYFS